jgi:hypothetical protein
VKFGSTEKVVDVVRRLGVCVGRSEWSTEKVAGVVRRLGVCVV